MVPPIIDLMRMCFVSSGNDLSFFVSGTFRMIKYKMIMIGSAYMKVDSVYEFGGN